MPERRHRFSGFTDLVSEVGRMNQLGRTGRAAGGSDSHERTFDDAWVPVADIFARGADLVIRLELPGVAPEDVDLTFSGGLLTVSGERLTEQGADEDAFYVRERYRGAFRRVMQLPEGTRGADIGAFFEAGLVEIVVTGGAHAEPERIALENRGGPTVKRSLG